MGTGSVRALAGATVVLSLAGCTPDSKNDVSKLRAEVAKLQERATAQEAELKELRGQLAAKTNEVSAIVERLSEVEKRSAPRPPTAATSDVEKRLAKLESRLDKDTLDIGTIKARTIAVVNPDGKNVILLNYEEDDENGAGGRILLASPDEQAEVRLRCTDKRSFATVKQGERRSMLGCDKEMSIFAMKRGEKSQFLVSQLGESAADVAAASKDGGALVSLVK
jgi:hypothetical protein